MQLVKVDRGVRDEYVAQRHQEQDHYERDKVRHGQTRYEYVYRVDHARYDEDLDREHVAEQADEYDDECRPAEQHVLVHVQVVDVDKVGLVKVE